VWTLWLCHLILLVPVLGLTEHPHYPSDRYSFIASITWSVLVAAGLLELGAWPRLRRVAPIGVAAMLAVLGTLTYHQSRIWQNSVALHEHMIEKLGDSPYRITLYLRLGRVYSEQGNEEKAADCFKQALQIDPNATEAHRNLALILQRQGDLEEAIKHHHEVLRVDPNDFSTRHNLGVALALQEKFEEAVAQLSEAARLDPSSANARRNLARALAKLGRIQESEAQEREAERLENRQKTTTP